MIEEAQRPGEYMTAFEDEHGTYIMNSKDLRAIAQYVERLTKMASTAKIEGRTKLFTLRPYRAGSPWQAIDDAAAGKPFDPTLLETLKAGSSRLYRRFPCVAIRTTITRITVRVLRFRTPAICRRVHWRA